MECGWCGGVWRGRHSVSRQNACPLKIQPYCSFGRHGQVDFYADFCGIVSRKWHSYLESTSTFHYEALKFHLVCTSIFILSSSRSEV